MALRSRQRTPPRDTATGGLHDEKDVARAYEAHGAELHRFALRCLGDPATAQDVVQDTFLRAWRAADRYDPQLASLRVWLFAIARNAVLDHVRAAGVRPWQSALVADAAEVVGGDAGEPAEDPGERLLRGWVVEEGLRRLTEDHRTAIVETYLKDRPAGEVAADLGVPIGTIRSRVFYGLKALRVAMDEMGVEP